MTTSTEDLKEITARINDIVNGHELNSILVCNPDTNCDQEDTWINPNDSNDINAYSHSDYYEVRWGQQPHRIKPGETRVMPAFLAKHYAKHLADHLLQKKESETGRIGLVSSPTERPKMLATILLKVQDYFMQNKEATPGQEVVKEVENLNKSEFSQGGAVNLSEANLGKVPDPMIGVLKKEPLSPQEIMSNAGLQPKTSIFDETKPKPTKKELLEEAMKLGIEVTGRETNDKLTEMIKNF